jgi:hypothetical protein
VGRFPWRTAGSFDLLKRAHKAGWAVPIEKAIPGDACVWNIGKGHCSMFERFDAKAKMVHTIDGNWGDKVVRVAHPVSQLRGCVHIHESRDAHPVKPATPPIFEVVTSASGTQEIVWSGTRKGLTRALANLLAKFRAALRSGAGSSTPKTGCGENPGLRGALLGSGPEVPARPYIRPPVLLIWRVVFLFWSLCSLALRCLFQLVLPRPRSEEFKELEIVVLRRELSALSPPGRSSAAAVE